MGARVSFVHDASIEASAVSRWLPFPPGYSSFDLDDERPTQKRSDRDQDAENGDILERRLEGRRAYDIGRHEHLEPEQQGVPKSYAEMLVCLTVIEHITGGEVLRAR
jgi:hypothetical protein